MAKPKNEKYNLIKEDLKDQLIDQNKLGHQYDDLLDHAVYLFELKDKLQNDINKNGIRIKSMTGNGYEKEDDNKSVDKLLKVSAQLMKVLNDLGLKEPTVDTGGENNDEDLL
ncbi:MAG: hypothetical protein PHU05_04100 [Bacilli bacterium]|nr:hypothetical protein [Bacilli bacterium]